MKNLRAPMLCACLMLCSFFAISQTDKTPINEPDYNRPKLFNNLPERISFNPESFFSFQNKQAGSDVRVSLSDKQQIPFEGTLVSSGENIPGKAQSLVIRSTNYNGATLSLSKRVNEDGSVTYIGRLLSFKHGDLFVLQQSEGHYELVKKNFYDLVNE
ncbi:MAG: hypothetical protein HZB42_00900 [Sphingobacteriales bacterium]|nr:hypothetical protein [Sphingobacteriales bacterium]